MKLKQEKMLSERPKTIAITGFLKKFCITIRTKDPPAFASKAGGLFLCFIPPGFRHAALGLKGCAFWAFPAICPFPWRAGAIILNYDQRENREGGRPS